MNKKPEQIATLFPDMRGVLPADGWNPIARKKAAVHFKFDHDIMEDRHDITAETFELGKITIEEYLKRVVFCDRQEFTVIDFKEFMFAQSAAHAEMLSPVTELKRDYDLKIVIVSNESGELNEQYRISSCHPYK